MNQMSNFDELNIVASEVADNKTKSNPVEIDKYFDEMDLDESAKENRKKLAHSIFSILSLAFAMIKATEVSGEKPDASYYADYVSNKLKTLYEDTFGTNKFENRIDLASQEIVNNTIENIDKAFYVSNERAIIDAENETNIAYGDSEFDKAIKDGYTMKKWVTAHDYRVRHTHRIIDGEELPIKEPFSVGTSDMMYPCDPDGSLKEIVNCRCTVKYFGKKSDYSKSSDN